MSRKLHGLFGLTGLVLVLLLAVSGTILAVFPVAARLAPEVQATQGLSVAQVAANVMAVQPEIETLKRLPSGTLETIAYDANGMAVQSYVNAATGAILHPAALRNPVYQALRSFHRAFLINGNTGRYISGLGAVLLTLMAGSGIFLMISRMGGVGRFFAPAKGNWTHRTHARVSRWVLVPLIISALTGVYIMAAQVSWLPVTSAESQLYPTSAEGLPAVTPDQLHGLAAIPLSDLRELTFPMVGDPLDVFTVKTGSQIIIVDQFNGDVLEVVPLTRSERLYDLFYRLHTGKGLAWFGAILGIAALGVPFLAATGSVIWWKRRQGSRRKIKGNVAANGSDIVVLVGSEGGTTWDFARSLHRDLTRAGLRVHVAAMNAFRGDYPTARHVLFLASTYGNGNAPASANRFRAQLANMTHAPGWSYAVLGFGDRAFAQFCEFAKDIDSDLQDHGGKRLIATSFINRQSSQAFASWGKDLAAALEVKLQLDHQIALPATRAMTLIERTVFGEEVQAPTAVLRFAMSSDKHASFWDRLTGKDGKRPRFAPSDLLGILPPGSAVPRYYSVASTADNQEVEICVRKQVGGECSTMLHDLQIGDQIQCFVRTNAAFQMPTGRKPVIMVAAGTGIAPFIGMIRANKRHRPVHLFWGGRDPDSDFLYRDDLAAGEKSQHLSSLNTAFSRVQNRAYVQDRVRQETDRLREMLRRGASVMVCGGDGMAQAVTLEFERLLSPMGLSVAQLKANDRYMEDIF
jgi:sulfite reductase (NADPH) flavoprotein alpha-component